MSYAGDIGPTECLKVLEKRDDAQLLDVRTRAEWAGAGIPDISQAGRDVLLVEWQTYPSMQVNEDFVAATQKALEDKGLGKETPIFTICSAGIRSIAAAEALTGAGFENVYNVLGGFEGRPGAQGRAGMVSGWKSEGLPWKR